MASRNRSEHLAVTVGRLLLILEDRAALNAVRDAVDRAEKFADDVFGAETDEFTWAERAELARQRAVHPGGPLCRLSTS
jgi:hypothetical protein